MKGPYPGGGAYIHTAHADAATVTEFRRVLRGWIASTVDLDAQRISDIVLATCEALTNCVEHAYQDRSIAATMTLTLAYNPDQGTAEICVTDHGCWQEPRPATIDALRGRGLVLMRALADTCTITSTITGTAVCLVFHHCPTRTAVS